jgi:hypothetical protein
MQNPDEATAVAAPPLRVTWLPVAALKPDPRNARKHPQRQIDAIAASIRAFGFTNPILIDGERNVIAGHGRLLAAQAIGMDEVPTIALEGLSPTQVRALRLADNRIAEGSGWDRDLLRIELVELSTLDLGIDLSITGFSALTTGVRLPRQRSGASKGVASAPRAAPRVRRGDIWQLGEHRIGCGDVNDRAFARSVLGEYLADAAVPDPARAALARNGAIHFVCGGGQLRGFEPDPDELNRAIERWIACTAGFPQRLTEGA